MQTTLLVGVGVILFGIIGVALTTQFIKDHSETKTFMLLLIAIGAFAFSLYSLYYFLTSLPTIEISDKRITIKTPLKRTDIEYKDIQSIGLMRKSPMSFMLITMPMESTSIMTKDFKEIIIWDDYYRNMGDIKFRLEKIRNGLKTGEFDPDNEVKSATTPMDLRLENFVEIKGNGLLNPNALIFWGLVVFWLIMLGPKLTANMSAIGFSLLMIGFFYGVFGFQLNYYLLSDNYFQIRNHLWIWKRKTFRLIDLKEIVFEEPHRLSKSVRVRTFDFRTTLHPGGSLRDKHWLELRDKLEKKGVEVRDELLHF